MSAAIRGVAHGFPAPSQPPFIPVARPGMPFGLAPQLANGCLPSPHFFPFGQPAVAPQWISPADNRPVLGISPVTASQYNSQAVFPAPQYSQSASQKSSSKDISKSNSKKKAKVSVKIS